MAVVMVGVDGSGASRHAVEFACLRARQLDFEMLIVHVIPWSPYSFSTPGENEYRSAQRSKELKAASEQIVDPMVSLAVEEGVEANAYVKHGDPVDVMVDLIRERDVEHLVVGRTGDSRVRRTFFGSTPSHLVQVAPVPVTVVP